MKDGREKIPGPGVYNPTPSTLGGPKVIFKAVISDFLNLIQALLACEIRAKKCTDETINTWSRSL